MQPNHTNTKLKAWFRRLLRQPATKRSGSILNWHTPGPTQGTQIRDSRSSTGIANRARR